MSSSIHEVNEMRNGVRKETIPWLMAAGRAALGPILIAGQRSNWSPLALAGIVVVALVSDIFDGVLARRWRCDTPAVRLFDSMADTFFYLCACAALWLGRPGALLACKGLVVVLLVAEVAKFGFDFWKFGRPASYHSYLAKSFGLVLAPAVVCAFAQSGPGWLMPLALGLGIASNLEGLAMSLMLDVRRVDVKSLWVAWRLRCESHPPGRRARRVIAGAALTLTLVMTCSAHAQSEPGIVHSSDNSPSQPASAGRPLSQPPNEQDPESSPAPPAPANPIKAKPKRHHVLVRVVVLVGATVVGVLLMRQFLGHID